MQKTRKWLTDSASIGNSPELYMLLKNSWNLHRFCQMNGLEWDKLKKRHKGFFQQLWCKLNQLYFMVDIFMYIHLYMYVLRSLAFQYRLSIDFSIVGIFQLPKTVLTQHERKLDMVSSHILKWLQKFWLACVAFSHQLFICGIKNAFWRHNFIWKGMQSTNSNDIRKHMYMYEGNTGVPYCTEWRYCQKKITVILRHDMFTFFRR